jgi:hypothetical protein
MMKVGAFVHSHNEQAKIFLAIIQNKDVVCNFF